MTRLGNGRLAVDRAFVLMLLTTTSPIALAAAWRLDGYPAPKGRA